MNSRAQGLGACRIFGTAVQVPDLRLVQGTKRTLLSIEVNEVLVLPVDHLYRSVAKWLEDDLLLSDRD